MLVTADTLSRVRAKEESWLMWGIYYLLLMRVWQPQFMESVSTTVFGRVYVPKATRENPRGLEEILIHEQVHLQDGRGLRSLYFSLSYIILPIGPSFRAYWEFRGYCRHSRYLYREWRGG